MERLPRGRQTLAWPASARRVCTDVTVHAKVESDSQAAMAEFHQPE